MSFEFNNKGFNGQRPSTHWNTFNDPLTPNLTPEHKHEFGMGYDIQYKDSSGNVQARMDGLRPDEAAFFRNIKGY